MAQRGRRTSEHGVLPRIQSRCDLLTFLSEGILKKDMLRINLAVDSVRVVKDPFERTAVEKLSLLISHMMQRLLRGNK